MDIVIIAIVAYLAGIGTMMYFYESYLERARKRYLEVILLNKALESHNTDLQNFVKKATAAQIALSQRMSKKK